MKKMIHFVHIHTGPEKIYQALTAEKGLASWWSTAVRVQPNVGGVINSHFKISRQRFVFGWPSKFFTLPSCRADSARWLWYRLRGKLPFRKFKLRSYPASSRPASDARREPMRRMD